MAYAFAGGAATDKIAGTITAVDSGAWSIAAWVNPTATTDLRRIVHVGSTSTGQLLYQLSDGPGIALEQAFSGGNSSGGGGIVRVGTGLTLSIWQLIVGTYDGNASGLSSGMHLYTGTETQAMANVDQAQVGSSNFSLDGIGSRSTGFTALTVGNRISDSARCFPGSIAQPLMVPWAMTLAQAEELRVYGIRRLLLTGAPTFVWLLNNPTVTDWHRGGNNIAGTITGATPAKDPTLLIGANVG